MISQETVDRLPVIPLNEFNEKVNELCKSNWVLKKLWTECGGLEEMAPHLQRDLFNRIGAKPLINKY